MSSFAVVCSPQTDVEVCESLPDFEAWLIRTFPDVRVIARKGSGVGALEWMRGDNGTPSWMGGSINEERTAVYLRGDPDLMSSTALVVRDLFPRDAAVTYTEDWQGIPFDLRKFYDPEVLTQAVIDGDVKFEWHPSAK